MLFRLVLTYMVIHTRVCMYTHICVHLYIYTYVYAHTYMFICTYTYINNPLSQYLNGVCLALPPFFMLLLSCELYRYT